METLIEYGYIGVFIAAFLAGTVLPFSSEVVLTGVLLAMGRSGYWPCILAASAGNFLGGMTCYWIGRAGKMEWIKKYFRMDISKLERVQNWIAKKGSWTALFVCLPGIGDFIAVALGFLKANQKIVAILMFTGKFVRYVIWVFCTDEIINFLKLLFPNWTFLQ